MVYNLRNTRVTRSKARLLQSKNVHLFKVTMDRNIDFETLLIQAKPQRIIVRRRTEPSDSDFETINNMNINSERPLNQDRPLKSILKKVKNIPFNIKGAPRRKSVTFPLNNGHSNTSSEHPIDLSTKKLNPISNKPEKQQIIPKMVRKPVPNLLPIFQQPTVSRSGSSIASTIILNRVRNIDLILPVETQTRNNNIAIDFEKDDIGKLHWNGSDESEAE